MKDLFIFPRINAKRRENFGFSSFSRSFAFIRGHILFTSFNNFLLGAGTSLLGSGDFDRYFKATDWNGFVVLHDAIQAGKLKRGDTFVLCASGGGINMAAMVLKY